MPMTSPPLDPVPWWGTTAAVAAPVALIGGWWWAGAITPGYDPIRQTISDLAAGDAPTHWLMTAALVVTGLAYIVTAIGLRPADGAGRALLVVGGIGVLLTAWIPNNTEGRNEVGHMIVAYLSFLALTVWPAVIARNRPDAPLVLRPRFGQVVAIGLGVLVLFTFAEIVTGGSTLGLRERVLAGAQSLVPLVVVLGCRRRGSAP
jgi:hypothetical membrane protein